MKYAFTLIGAGFSIGAPVAMHYGHQGLAGLAVSVGLVLVYIGGALAGIDLAAKIRRP